MALQRYRIPSWGLYRVRQFFAQLSPQVSAETDRMVQAVFSPQQAALSLFQRMSLADQQHAIAVLHTLQGWEETEPTLLQAALLHDVGKALGQPLLYRVIIVLLQTLWPTVLERLTDAPLDCSAWRRPFVIHAQHPQIGATWAEEAGCEPLVVKLIDHHQDRPPSNPTTQFEILQATLYKADNLN